MKVTILEKVKYNTKGKNNTEAYKRQREKLLIPQFDTFHNALYRMVKTAFNPTGLASRIT